MCGSLYEQICDRDLLVEAWKAVEAKRSAGGVDGVSVDLFAADLERNLQRLHEELVAGTFIPQPYREIRIPKEDDEFRTLGLMSVRDKIAQQACRMVLEPILDRLFLDVSYAYRKGRGAGRAIARVHHMIVYEKREWVTLCDIDSYFDNINHDRLMTMLARRINDEPFLRLLRIWLKMGRVDRGLRWTDSVKGIPQGGIISPLLSNFYLNPLDHFCDREKFGYVRYADDFVVLSQSREEAQRALDAVSAFLARKLDLRLNPDCGVRHVGEGFQFLGILFKGGERVLSEEKLASLKERIRAAIGGACLTEPERVRESLRGIEAYYAKILPQGCLESLDETLASALKEKARQAWEQGAVTSKRELAGLLARIGFFSDAWRVRANREIREITAACGPRQRKKSTAQADEKAAVPRDPVRKRKREYEKLESAGFELLLNRPGLFVGSSRKGIVVKERGQVVRRENTGNLRHILIAAPGVAVSSNLVFHAARNRILIDFIENTGLPYARIVPFHGTNADLQRAQLSAETNGKASRLAMAFVRGKIRNQMNLVKYYHKYRKAFDEGFVREFNEKLSRMQKIEGEIRELREPDPDTLRGKLFSIEGRAAAAYWDIVKTLLDEVIVFEGRTGKGATDLINSLLNYGYGILYTKVWNAVQRVGLNPYISFLHKPQEGKPTLVFDLIEEFRPQAVDRVVFSQINSGVAFKMDGTLLSDETRKRLAEEVLERMNAFETFRGRRMRLVDIMHEQAQNAAAFLLGRKSSYAPYLGKW